MLSIGTQRRWLRFSLRGLFVIVTVIAIWMGISVHQIRTQRDAVRQIQAAGGTVMYDYHEVSPRTVSTAGKPRGPEWLRNLAGPELFDRPVWVSLYTPHGDEWSDALAKLP